MLQTVCSHEMLHRLRHYHHQEQNKNLSYTILTAKWKCLQKMIIYWNIYSPEGKCSFNILTTNMQHLLWMLSFQFPLWLWRSQHMYRALFLLSAQILRQCQVPLLYRVCRCRHLTVGDSGAWNLCCAQHFATLNLKVKLNLFRFVRFCFFP